MGLYQVDVDGGMSALTKKDDVNVDEQTSDLVKREADVEGEQSDLTDGQYTVDVDGEMSDSRSRVGQHQVDVDGEKSDLTQKGIEVDGEMSDQTKKGIDVDEQISDPAKREVGVEGERSAYTCGQYPGDVDVNVDGEMCDSNARCTGDAGGGEEVSNVDGEMSGLKMTQDDWQIWNNVNVVDGQMSDHAIGEMENQPRNEISHVDGQMSVDVDGEMCDSSARCPMDAERGGGRSKQC